MKYFTKASPYQKFKSDQIHPTGFLIRDTDPEKLFIAEFKAGEIAPG